ncbi:MAG: CoA pyrophosphatase [Magnetococcales bacterium]|nr:CoA pyrophosphatase [Magnetococcales bacterium]
MVTPDIVSQRILPLPPLDRPTGPIESGCIVAAVLVPLIFPVVTVAKESEYRDNGHILFIRRSETVRHHKGQIAFPGGRWDHDDATLLQTALRETTEELGPQARPLQILGALPSVQTNATGFIIHPFVGLMPEAIHVQPEPREVAGVITVPLDFFLRQPGNPDSYHFGPHIIWGATARILNRFMLFLRGDSCS